MSVQVDDKSKHQPYTKQFVFNGFYVNNAIIWR